MIIMPNTIERLNEELRRIRGELQQVKKPKKIKEGRGNYYKR